MDKKIVITPRSLSKGGHPALKLIEEAGYSIVCPAPGKQPNESELLNTIGDAVGLLAGVEPVSAKVLEQAKNLKVISRNGIGIDNIDLEAAEKLNIKICKTPGANARGVAELTFAHILASIRNIPQNDADMKSKNWKRNKGQELEGKTLGLVGCGAIGKIVATFALAFDMNILAYDPYPDNTFNPGERFKFCSKEVLLESADIISLHCPSNPDHSPVIGQKELDKMKEGLFLINTARYNLLDKDAVHKALDAGKIKGLTLDAFDQEPPADWSLVTHPNVIATSHIGGYTVESIDRSTYQAVENLLDNL